MSRSDVSVAYDRPSGLLERAPEAPDVALSLESAIARASTYRDVLDQARDRLSRGFGSQSDVDRIAARSAEAEALVAVLRQWPTLTFRGLEETERAARVRAEAALVDAQQLSAALVAARRFVS